MKNNISINLGEHNTKVLAKYKHKHIKLLRIAMLDQNLNILKVFKNRYQAGKYIYKNNISEHVSKRGHGYATASITGSLTNAICARKDGYAYGYHWKLLDSDDHRIRTTETPIYERKKSYLDRPIRYIGIKNNKEYKFYTYADIRQFLKISRDKIGNIIKNNISVNGMTIIPYQDSPIKKEFNSITQAAKYLRVSYDTIKNSLNTGQPIRNYIVFISEENMNKNKERIKKSIYVKK